MLTRIIGIVLLATVLLTACMTMPSPQIIVETVKETVVVEVTPVPADEGPEPVELLMWGENCAMTQPDEGCGNFNEAWCDGTLMEPGDQSERYVAEWHDLHPEYSHINVKCVIATYGGGRIGQELSAMVRAGEGPNIYTLGGARSWLAYEIGIDLDKYLSDEDKAAYINYDQWLAEDGTLRILPGWGVFEYPVANKHLIERACAQEGFDCAPPEPWTVMPYDGFLEIAEAIKALDDGSYMGIVWGSGASSQQLNWMWYAQAGIPASRDGRFTGFDGGEEVLVELLRLYDEGYLYPDVAGISDDDAFPLWGKGKIAIHMAGLRFHSYRDSAVAAGEAEHWDIIPLLGIQFKEGVAPLITGGAYSFAGFIADNTPEVYREAAANFMVHVLSASWAREDIFMDGFLLQYSQVERNLVMPGTRDEAIAYIDEVGLGEAGYRLEIYNRVRSASGEMLTSVFLHMLTPEEGLAQLRATIAELQGE